MRSAEPRRWRASVERSNVSHPPRQPRDTAARKIPRERARAQALYPSTADVDSVPSPFRPNESVPFDEFSFTVVLTYNGRQIPGDPSSSEICRSAAFEYMRLTGKQDEMGGLGMGPLMFVVSPEDLGHEVMPLLRVWPLKIPATEGLHRRMVADTYPHMHQEIGPPPSKWPFSTPLHQTDREWGRSRVPPHRR